MATSIRARQWFPTVNFTILVPTLALIAAETWYLATQAESIVLPLIWMAPMDLLLLLYAVEESVALWNGAALLFLARFVLLPFFLMARLDNLLLFYALFMAPVDLLVLGYMAKAAGRRLTSASTA